MRLHNNKQFRLDHSTENCQVHPPATSANRKDISREQQLSTSQTCSKCGTLNAEWAKFCAKCGNPLTPIPQTQTITNPVPAVPPPIPPPPWQYYNPPGGAALQRTTEVDRTKTGLLLLMIGTILGPVPIITFVGSILALIGAILVILGRKAFGASHSRNAIWSIIIYAVGIVVIIVGAIAFALSVITATISTNTGTGPNIATLSQALTSAFNTLLITVVISSVIFGIAQVLFTYAIQNQNGRIILWAAYASSVAISVIDVIIISQLLSNAVQ